ncbi:MAG: hypothetical protein ABEJ57_00160 [Halobacteriaceae archaeon]
MAVIRLLLAVLVATSLLAVALPAIDTAREDAAATAARGELTTIEHAIHRLATTNDPVPVGLPAARRQLTVTVPDAGPGSTGVSYLAIGGNPTTTTRDGPTGDILVYRLPGGPTHTIRTSVDLRVVLDGRRQDDATPIIIRDSTRLTLTLVTVEDTVVVRITTVRL